MAFKATLLYRSSAVPIRTAPDHEAPFQHVTYASTGVAIPPPSFHQYTEVEARAWGPAHSY